MMTELRKARVLAGWTIYDVRASTGISISRISLIERGLERPNEKEKRLLAQALNLNPEDVGGGQG